MSSDFNKVEDHTDLADSVADNILKFYQKCYERKCFDSESLKTQMMLLETTLKYAPQDMVISYRKKLAAFHKKATACYIATAVYGSYDAPSVLVLRRYRDDVLQHNVFGRAFIKVYYALSPPIARWLKDAEYVNGWVKRRLDRWVEHLKNK